MLTDKYNISYLNSQCYMIKIVKKESYKTTYQHQFFKKSMLTIINNINFFKIQC